jgi:hypothetical protein
MRPDVPEGRWPRGLYAARCSRGPVSGAARGLAGPDLVGRGMRWFLAGLSGLERLRAEGWRNEVGRSRRAHACPAADSAPYPDASTPIVIRGEAAGLSQRRISSSSLTGNVTQPAVGVPMLMCRKIALPSPGVRAVLYAITVP